MQGKSHPRRPDGTAGHEDFFEADPKPPQRPLVALAAGVGAEPKRLGRRLLPLAHDGDRHHQRARRRRRRLEQVDKARRRPRRHRDRPAGRAPRSRATRHRLLVDRAVSRRLGRSPLKAADDVALQLRISVAAIRLTRVRSSALCRRPPAPGSRRRGGPARRGSAAPAGGARRRARARARAAGWYGGLGAGLRPPYEGGEDGVAGHRVAVRPVEGVEQRRGIGEAGEQRLVPAHGPELPLEREGGGRSEELRMQRRPGGSQRTPASRPGVRGASSWPGQGVARLSGG